MKILMINSVSGIRSTGRICVEIAEEYISNGHEVKIAYGREDVPEKYKEISVRIGSQKDVYLAVLKSRLLDNEGFNNKIPTRKFLKWADDYNPDILWLHNLHGYYINIEMLFNWIKTRPAMKVKWTLHDCWTFTGHCAHFTLAKCDKWKTQCQKCTQVRIYPKGVLLDNSTNNYLNKKRLFTKIKDMELIVPSNWLADLVKQSFLKEYPIKVVRNKIDTLVFRYRESDFRERYNLLDKKIVLGVASDWSDKKGLSDFIKLSQLLDEQFVVVLVGVTKKQKKLIPSNIIIMERTNNAIELAEIYSASDVFLNLTYEDNYPTVNLEAQACGTPCLTYRTGGSPESVYPLNTIDVGDLNMLINRIYEISCENN